MHKSTVDQDLFSGRFPAIPINFKGCAQKYLSTSSRSNAIINNKDNMIILLQYEKNHSLVCVGGSVGV